MKRFTILAAIIASALLAWQPVLHAEGKERGPFRGPGPKCDDHSWMDNNLGLNNSQIKRLDEIDVNFEKKMLECEEKSAPRLIRLQRMLLEDSVDMGKIRPLIKEISELMAEMQMIKIQHHADIDSVFTIEQRNKIRLHMMFMMDDDIGPSPEEPGPPPPLCGF